MQDILAGAVMGTFAGITVWWLSRLFITNYRTPPAIPEKPPANPDAPPLPAGVLATNPLTPAGGGEGVLLPNDQPDSVSSVQSGRLTSASISFFTPRALIVCIGLALWGAYVGWRAPALPAAVGALLVSAVLLTISLVDLRVRRIPNILVIVLLAWAVIQSFWLGRPALDNLVIALLAAGGFFLLLALFTRGAMGIGDVKLAAAIGALVGWPVMIAALVLGIVAGGMAAIVLLVTRRAGRKDYFAYGPYLALGAWIVYSAFLGLWR